MESNEKALTASKEFNVPVEALYTAWTDPEELKQWWKPMKMTLTEVVNEVKQEGQIAYHFEGEAGAALTIKGTYQEVQPGERLVYSWNWELSDDKLNSQFKLDVHFKTTGSGSSIEITQQEEADQEPVKPKEAGWEQELNNLASYLENGQQDAQQGSSESGNENSSSSTLTNAQHTDASSTPEEQEGKPDYGSQNPLENQ